MNIKIVLGCFGVASFLGGSILKGLKEEKTQKELESNLKGQSDLSKQFEELKKDRHERFEILRKRLNKEEA